MSVYEAPDQTIHVFDPIQQRVVVLDSSGAPLATRPVALPPGFIVGRLVERGLIAVGTDMGRRQRRGDSTAVGIYLLGTGQGSGERMVDLPVRQPAYGLADMRPQPKLFEARPMWQIGHDGSTCFADGREFLVTCFDATGQPVMRTGFQLPPRPVEDAEVEREQARRLRGLPRMPALHPERQHPAVTAIRLFDTGDLWVRESPDARGESVWWVRLSSDGTAVGRLQLAPEDDLLAGRDSTLLVFLPTGGGVLLAKVRGRNR